MTVIESDVQRAQAGDEDAFARLVERSANTVCSIALAIVRNVAASEDIAQETFAAAWQNRATLRNPASFLPWLRQVARNQAHLWRRAHQREIANDDALAAATDARPLPDHALLATEEQRVLAEVLDQLPDESREVLVLFYREGSSTKHVAELLGISDDAVRQRLTRSRAMVRAEMLERFGKTVARTAPGAAFVAAVTMTISAPAASAAIASSTTAASLLGVKGAVATAALLGGALGWFGVLMGMRALEPVLDEREERELRRFRNQILALVTIGCIGVAISAAASVLAMVITLQSLYIIVFLLYVVRLPRILKRRPPSNRPLRGMIGRAVGAAIVGVMLMAVVILVML